MLSLRDPKLLADNHTPMLHTAMRPELHISTVEPYYGSPDPGSESHDEEDELGQILDHRMCSVLAPAILLKLTRWYVDIPLASLPRRPNR